MNIIDLNKLPEEAQKELIDFYEFLLQKYQQKNNPLQEKRKQNSLTKRLKGLLENTKADEKDYYQYLEEKYL